MWIEKDPKPLDFCGTIPCPLCYDYVEDNGNRTQGMRKFISDIMQGGEPSAYERDVLVLTAQRMHEDRLCALSAVPQDAGPTGETFEEMQERAFFDIRLNALGKERDRALALKQKKPRFNRRKTLDEIDVEKAVKKPKGAGVCRNAAAS